jgi:hypothetical protein
LDTGPDFVSGSIFVVARFKLVRLLLSDDGKAEIKHGSECIEKPIAVCLCRLKPVLRRSADLKGLLRPDPRDEELSPSCADWSEPGVRWRRPRSSPTWKNASADPSPAARRAENQGSATCRNCCNT